ncbi:glycoside hydrolase family 57 [Chitinispirillum alkaliphilum]|nr:glycoside hydrolase family 57 [Chitinispirillum alkaliphilum]
MPRAELEHSINSFVDKIVQLSSKYTHNRFNIILPAYILELIDPLKLSILRELSKKGVIEWILTGYTEPFVSFSPDWLTMENIRHGLTVFDELTGSVPIGYCPPYSNWEPSHIDQLKNAGIKYAVISRESLALEAKNSCGYWITEHTGSSMAIFPSTVFSSADAPKRPANWIAKELKQCEYAGSGGVVIIKYLFALKKRGGEKEDPNRWLDQICSTLNRKILHYHPSRVQDIITNTAPLGLQYIPPCLIPSRKSSPLVYFRNHLHCHDQFGILQRKMIEICNNLQEMKNTKPATTLQKELFKVQDINRFLPTRHSGFTKISDRLWTYSKLIGIERQLNKQSSSIGGQIRLTDFLRNGYKSILLSNKHIKMYVDHKKGGNVFEIDYISAEYNMCATYNPRIRKKPDLLVPGESRFSFVDRIHTEDFTTVIEPIIKRESKSDFPALPFDYTFKKTKSGTKIVLRRQGSFIKEEKQLPLGMEKVFGLEREKPVVTFAYQLRNPSLTDYHFYFATELSLALPGALNGTAKLIYNNEFQTIGTEPLQVNDLNAWSIEDHSAGIVIKFKTQKNLTVLITPSDYNIPSHEQNPSNGISLMLISPVTIEKSSTWANMGKLTFKKAAAKGGKDDLI